MEFILPVIIPFCFLGIVLVYHGFLCLGDIIVRTCFIAFYLIIREISTIFICHLEYLILF